MNLRVLLTALATASLLAACSSGPVRKVHPSTATIQQLSVQPDGSWKIALRIQNFSTMPMHYSAITASLSIAGVEAGAIDFDPGIDIVANSGDVVETTLKPTTTLPPGSDFAYQLKGKIQTSEPKASFNFDRNSRLSPIPGVADTYR